jgi:DNA-binding MarR family transcriptional regulator
MAEQIDIKEVSGCLCLGLRRAARQVCQIYDRALQPVGITANQFGVLALLYGSSLEGHDWLSIGALANLVGKHPSTLNRDLKPLSAEGMISSDADPEDRRVRAVVITAKGRARLRRAVPFWRRAQTQVREAVGADTARALKGLLDLTSARMTQ